MKLPQKVVRPVTLFSMGAFVVLAAAPAVLGEMGVSLCGSCSTGSVAMAAAKDGCGDGDKDGCGATAASAGLASLLANGQCTAPKAAATAASGCCSSKAAPAKASLASLESAASCGDKGGCGDKGDSCGATAATASLASLESAASCGDKGGCGDKGDSCGATATPASLAKEEATCCSAAQDAADKVAAAN